MRNFFAYLGASSLIVAGLCQGLDATGALLLLAGLSFTADAATRK